VVNDRIEILDPLEDLDAEPLAAVLADPGIEVILHAGRQDVALLKRSWRTEVRNIFDTQIAAGFAGFSAQAGYNGLLHDVLRIRLPKTASFTRWDARPLTEEQVSYARGDVEHLMPLADNIQERLTYLRWLGAMSERLKKNKRPINNVAARVAGMAKAAMLYERDGKTRVGFGAQTLEKAVPECVFTADDLVGTKSVNYPDMIAILAVQLQELTEKIEALEAQKG